MMIGHMLRSPHHRKVAPRLRDAHDDAGTGALAGLDVREGAYYYARDALHAGSVLAAARLGTSMGDPASSPHPAAGVREFIWPAAATELRTLNVTYDRYALVDELVLPPAPAWPLRLRLSGFALALPEVAAAANASHLRGKARSAPALAASPREPPVYIGLQAASAPRLRSTLVAQHAANTLTHLACLLFLALVLAAVVGHGRGDGSARSSAYAHDDAPSSDSELELLPTAPAVGASTVAVGVPVGHVVSPTIADGTAALTASASAPRVSADGELLSVGTRVQTQHTIARGGDDSWYAATVLSLHVDGRSATLIYDDGEEEQAPLNEVYMLQGHEDDEEAARATPAHEAARVPPAREAAPQRDYDRTR